MPNRYRVNAQILLLLASLITSPLSFLQPYEASDMFNGVNPNFLLPAGLKASYAMDNITIVTV